MLRRYEVNCTDLITSLDDASQILHRGTSADRQIAEFELSLYKFNDPEKALRQVVENLSFETAHGLRGSHVRNEECQQVRTRRLEGKTTDDICYGAD
jgi:hypothetical protein